MKNPWQWIWEWTMQAQEDGDFEKLRLPAFLEQAESYSSEEPDARLALYERGRELAAQMQEPWWVVLFEYWKCETLLYYKHDPEAALQLAARLVVETRKPQYAALPERVGLSLNFIAAYSKIDPIGYQKPIWDAIEAGQDDWAIYEGYHQVYWQLRTRFLTAIDNPEALDAAWDHYQVSWQFHANTGDSSAHYVIYALADLLPALWLFDRESARLQTAEMAELGRELSPLSDNDRLVAVFTMWSALGARFEGDEEEAARFYRRAFEKQANLSVPRNAIYFAALAFHEAGGEWDRMLAVCEEAIEVAIAHKLRFETATLRWRKCEILKRMGRGWDEEATRLRVTVASLPSKAHWEDRLATLRGES
jgi:hypothetical protein